MLHVLHRVDLMATHLPPRDPPTDAILARTLRHSGQHRCGDILRLGVFLVILADRDAGHRRGIQLGLGHLRCGACICRRVLCCQSTQSLPWASGVGQAAMMAESRSVAVDNRVFYLAVHMEICVRMRNLGATLNGLFPKLSPLVV